MTLAVAAAACLFKAKNSLKPTKADWTTYQHLRSRIQPNHLATLQNELSNPRHRIKDVRWNNEGSFLNDLHKDLKADYLLANPPFNDSDWKGEMLREDIRWKYGIPPVENANFAWVQHFIHHLAPHGIAGFVLANGSMSTNTSNEGEIRKNIIEADMVDCMVALPSQLFYNTMIPACLWFIARDKQNNKFRDRRGEILFIDARKLGVMVDRRHRELTQEDIKKISDTYHAWRGEPIDGQKVEYAGYCWIL